MSETHVIKNKEEYEAILKEFLSIPNTTDEKSTIRLENLYNRMKEYNLRQRLERLAVY